MPRPSNVERPPLQEPHRTSVSISISETESLELGDEKKVGRERVRDKDLNLALPCSTASCSELLAIKKKKKKALFQNILSVPLQGECTVSPLFLSLPALIISSYQ